MGIHKAASSCINSTFSIGGHVNKRVSNMLILAEGRDKCIKAIGAGLGFGKWIATEVNADVTADKFDKGKKICDIGRDVTGIFNIGAGVIPNAINAVSNIGKLVLGIIKGKKEIEFKSPPEEVMLRNFQNLANETNDSIIAVTVRKKAKLKHNDKAVGHARFIVLGREILKTLSLGAYSAAFGPIKGAYILNTHCDVPMGQTAQKMASSFTHAFTVYHGLQWGYHLFDFAFQHMAYKQALKTDGVDQNAAYQIYTNTLTQNSIGFIEKNLDLALDVTKLLKYTDPKFVAPVSLVVGVLGFVKVYLKAA